MNIVFALLMFVAAVICASTAMWPSIGFGEKLVGVLVASFFIVVVVGVWVFNHDSDVEETSAHESSAAGYIHADMPYDRTHTLPAAGTPSHSENPRNETP